MSAEAETKPVSDPVTTDDPTNVESKEASSTTTTQDAQITQPEESKEDVKTDDKDEKATEEKSDQKNGRESKMHNRDERSDRPKKFSRDGDRKFNKHHYNDRSYKKENIKSRYDQEVTDDPDKIREQVEFYLSDSNLQMDRFMFEKIGGSENNPVDLKVIHSFKRMQRFQPYSVVVKAMKDSETIELLNEDKPNDEQIRRKVALPEDIGTNFEEVRVNYGDKLLKRSIYAKGFGEETSSTQLDIEELFKPYGAKSVRLRRLGDNHFKGSAFIEFQTVQEMKDFLDQESKPEWNGKPLLIKSKEEYCAGKTEDINSGKIRRGDLEPSGRRGRGGFRDRGDRGGRGGRGDGRGGRGGRHNDRRRSRSGSRERKPRDLKSKNWRELAAEEESARKAKTEPQQEFEENGIPKVLSSPETTPKKAKTETPAGDTNGKKRAREEDGAATEDSGDAKKAKTEVEATDA